MAPDPRTDAVTQMLDLLQRSSSGRAFVGECLRAAVRTWDLQGAALVMWDGGLGRIVVTHDDAPPTGELAVAVEAQQVSGLVAVPALPPDPIPWAVSHVARMALTLDRRGWVPGVDADTGLYTIEAFRRLMVLSGERHRFGQQPFSILALDVESDAPEAGEQDVEAVARTAAAISATMRRVDAAARVSGTRLAVVLDGADRNDTRAFLRRVETLLAADEGLADVDVHIGVASCPEDDADVPSLVRLASDRLRQAEIAIKRPTAIARPAADAFDPEWLRPEVAARPSPSIDQLNREGPFLTPPRPVREMIAAPLPERPREPAPVCLEVALPEGTFATAETERELGAALRGLAAERPAPRREPARAPVPPHRALTPPSPPPTPIDPQARFAAAPRLGFTTTSSRTMVEAPPPRRVWHRRLRAQR